MYLQNLKKLNFKKEMEMEISSDLNAMLMVRDGKTFG